MHQRKIVIGRKKDIAKKVHDTLHNMYEIWYY
jgi:hypothetical protein